MNNYLQIILLLGISLGCLVNADEITCTQEWLLQGFQSDTCYYCKDSKELQTWCISYKGGEDPAPLTCCELHWSDFANIMPTELYEGSTDNDIIYEYEYEDYDDYEDYDSEEDYMPYDIEDFEYYDSGSDTDDDFFPGFDLNDDELAGPITNDEVNNNILLPLPSSVEDFESVVLTPPSLVDFTASQDCPLANILGNNYIDACEAAHQQCVADLKEQLREEFNSFLEQVAETKGSYEAFLEKYSDELPENEIEDIRSQLLDIDAQVVERSQRMRAKIQNPNCTEYTHIERDSAILQAVDTYNRVLGYDEGQAGVELVCFENYLRSLQTLLETCEYQVTNTYGQLFEEDKTALIYEKMCRSGDVQHVKDIGDAFFAVINYESTYPTPVVEPMYEPYYSIDTADDMEQRRGEINRELEELQQELDVAVFEKNNIFRKLVEVSNRRVYVEGRVNELKQSENLDSDEGIELSDELEILVLDEDNLKSELTVVYELINEIETEMKTLLSEEIQLEMQLGILPHEESQTDSSVQEFLDNIGPGPVFNPVTDEIKTDTPNVDEKPKEDTEEIIVIIDEVPTNSPVSYVRDYVLIEEPEPEKHHGSLSKYLIGVMIAVLVLLGVLILSLCIPLVVFLNRNKGKKIPYDQASLAEKDPALLLKQTGFENPIYKFYAETTSKQDN